MISTQGIIIYLQSEHAENPAIGLYTIGGASYLRWAESLIPGMSNWADGIISDAGMPAITESGNITKGGGIAVIESMRVSVNNASKMWKILQDAGIQINNRRIEIVEYEYDGEAISASTIYRGVASVTEWGFVKYGISIEPAHHNRNANMATTINATDYPHATKEILGEAVPITIGEFNGDRYAKLNRVADAETAYTNLDILSMVLHEPGSVTVSPEGIDYFPVISAEYSDGTDAPPTVYNVRLYDTASADNWAPVAIVEPENLYVKVIEHKGDGDIEGEYRKVTRLLSTGVDAEASIRIELDLPMQNSMNPVTSNSVGTWIQFVSVEKQYQADVWPCTRFARSTGQPVSDRNLELYAYSDRKKADLDTGEIIESPPQYIQIPPYFLEISGSAEQNRLSLATSQFNDDKGKVKAHLILPFQSVELFDGENLDQYGLGEFAKVQDGYYRKRFDGDAHGEFSTSGEIINLTDRSETTTFSMITSDVVSMPPDGGIASYKETFVLKLTLPEYPASFDPSKIMLGIRADINPGDGVAPLNAFVRVLSRKWYRQNNNNNMSFDGFQHLRPDLTGMKISSLPDWYFSGYPATEYKDDFYFETPEINNYFFEMTGASRFETLDADQQSYANTNELLLFVSGEYPGPDDDVVGWVLRIVELALIFEKSLDIKSEIYTPFAGRRYDDDWGGRRDPSNVIRDPRDYYEHLCRIQNWSETGDDVTIPGRAYSPEALINLAWLEVVVSSVTGSFQNGETVAFSSGGSGYLIESRGDDTIVLGSYSGSLFDGDTLTGETSGATAVVQDKGYNTGGFDSPQTSDLANLRVSLQLTDDAEMWTSEQKKAVARHCFFTGYVNERGEESISFLPKRYDSEGGDLYAPLDTITLADVPVDHKIGEVQEPEHSRVFCEPYVRYKYDSGSEKYTEQLIVKNVSSATFAAGHTAGFENDVDAQRIWSRCRNELWSRFRFVGKPPSSMTDLPFFYRYEDALWYLDRWIDWMQLRVITVPVYYALARRWHVGRHVYLNLPHQTDGESLECVVDRIVKNHTKGVCQLRLAIIDSVTEPEPLAQVIDTMDETNPNWINTTTEYGTDSDKVEIV